MSKTLASLIIVSLMITAAIIKDKDYNKFSVGMMFIVFAIYQLWPDKTTPPTNPQ